MQKISFVYGVLWFQAASTLFAQTNSLTDAYRAPVRQVALILEGGAVQLTDPVRDPEAKDSGLGNTTLGNPGPGIKQEILRVLNDAKVSINEAAKFQLKTFFAVVDSPDDKNSPEDQRLLAVSIRMLLVSRETQKGEGAISFTAKIGHASQVRDIIKVAGVSGVINPDNVGTKEDHAELRRQIGKPPAIEGMIARAAPNSPYGMEILVDGKPRPLSQVGNDAFVQLNQGDEYEVRVVNTSGEEIAVALSIDGVNVFEFAEKEFRDPKTNRPIYDRYVVDKVDVIEGWFTRLSGPDNYDAFLVTEYGKGAASKLGKPQGIGVIHLAISKSYPAGKGSRAGLETGFGRKKTINVQAVKRDIDPPHEFITVRYVR